MERKKLTDILNGNAETLKAQWDGTEAAGEMGPLPPGSYVCATLGGELFQAKTGTPGYRLTLRVADGPFSGRRVWHDLWLTAAALPMAKRDLAKLGINGPEQLERPLPAVFRLKVDVATKKDDDGNTGNRVRGFELLGIEPADEFAPPQAGGSQ